MKNLVALVCVLCVVAAIPVPETQPQSSLDLLQIPLGNNKELDILSLADENGKLTERNKRTIDVLRQLFPTLTQAANSENEAGVDPNALNDELVQTIRRVREAAAVAEQLEKEKENKKFEVKVELPSDQDPQASETENKSVALDELSLDNEADDENRNKRFLSFGASSGGGGGGGSGNFLFDIIRTGADRVARAAGTVYRVVAGTESIDSALSSGSSPSTGASAALQSADSSTATTTTNTTSPSSSFDDEDDNLISGSSGTQDSDERANSADGAAVHASADGYTEGIPGPVTRLIVLANRGLSNLIQDLILRLAQTSERVVNFKARLITSLI